MLEWNPGWHNFLGLALVAHFCQLGPVSQRLHGFRCSNWGLLAQTSKWVEYIHRTYSLILGFILPSSSFMYLKLIRCSHEIAGDICCVYNPLQTSWFTALLSGLPECSRWATQLPMSSISFWNGERHSYCSVWLCPRHIFHGTQWELGVSAFGNPYIWTQGQAMCNWVPGLQGAPRMLFFLCPSPQKQ